MATVDAVESVRHGKRRAPKDCPFKVIRELTNPKKQKYSLQILKPDVQNKIVGITYPSVYLKKERANNRHALNIMHNLNHPNILSMKSVAQSEIETNDPLSVMAFVEPYDGLLWSKFKASEECVDKLHHIPKPELRVFLRGIVTGLDYLWTRELYHGNLSWDSTLYYEATSKLAGFEELKTSIDEAQWNDMLCLIKMLEVLAERAMAANHNMPQEKRYFCGELNSLISLLKALKQTPVTRWKEIILEHTFFWDVAKKVNFFANDVSLLLSNEQFMQRVRLVRLSAFCGEDWDKNCCTGEFKVLVKAMNNYRGIQKTKRRGSKSGKPYNGKRVEDYVRCVCGAFTHWKQLKVNVDRIVRRNHPTICSDLKCLVDSVEVPNKVPIQFGPFYNFEQNDMNKVTAPSKPSELTLAGAKEGKKQENKQCMIEVSNKVPIQFGSLSNLVQHDMSEPTAAGETSKLTSAGAKEGKEQENKQCMAKVSNKVPIQFGSLSNLVLHDMSEPTAAGETFKLTSAGAKEGKEQENKQCMAKISGNKSSKKTDGGSACGG